MRHELLEELKTNSAGEVAWKFTRDRLPTVLPITPTTPSTDTESSPSLRVLHCSGDSGGPRVAHRNQNTMAPASDATYNSQPKLDLGRIFCLHPVAKW